MAQCFYFKPGGAAYIDSGFSPTTCQQYIALEPTEYAQFQALLAATANPYDYAGGVALWTFFFSTTLGFWLLAKNLGTVLDFIRRR